MDDLNWYAYCGGNPVNAVDPMGLTVLSPDGDLDSDSVDIRDTPPTETENKGTNTTPTPPSTKSTPDKQAKPEGKTEIPTDKTDKTDKTGEIDSKPKSEPKVIKPEPIKEADKEKDIGKSAKDTAKPHFDTPPPTDSNNTQGRGAEDRKGVIKVAKEGILAVGKTGNDISIPLGGVLWAIDQIDETKVEKAIKNSAGKVKNPNVIRTVKKSNFFKAVVKVLKSPIVSKILLPGIVISQMYSDYNDLMDNKMSLYSFIVNTTLNLVGLVPNPYVTVAVLTISIINEAIGTDKIGKYLGADELTKTLGDLR